MAAWVLFLSSLSGLLLLVLHSWRRRGARVTAAFFIPAVLFGILRGNVVHNIMSALAGPGFGSRPYLPQNPVLPDIGHASIQVVIGRLRNTFFAGSSYRSVCFRRWPSRRFSWPR